MYIDKIIAGLSACKKTSQNTYQAQCPAHNDKKPSLTITDTGDKILLHCHAGCDTLDILNKLGLTEKDLFYNCIKEKSKVVDEYIYKDENNNPLYKVVRFEPKSFAQAQYNNGEWIFKMSGVKYVLYNLPEVLNSDTIYWVEGEKDANNLSSLGLTSTTTIGRSSKLQKT